MKQIVLCPIVIVTVDDEEKVFVDMNFYSSISEAMDDDGEFRDVTDDERIFIDDKVLPFITKSIDLSGNSMTHEEVIQEIIRIVRVDGELATDGQCLEMVSNLLDENGYGPVYPAINRTGDLGEFGKAFE